MNVDIDQLGIYPNVDHRYGMPASFEHPLVAILERVEQRPRADRAAVDGEHDSVPAAAAHARLAHHPRDEWHADNLEHLCGDWKAMDRTDPAPPVTVAGAADSTARVDAQLEAHVRMEQCECAYDILYCRHLSVVGLEKFEPSRNVGEEVLDLERHP